MKHPCLARCKSPLQPVLYWLSFLSLKNLIFKTILLSQIRTSRWPCHFPNFCALTLRSILQYSWQLEELETLITMFPLIIVSCHCLQPGSMILNPHVFLVLNEFTSHLLPIRRLWQWSLDLLLCPVKFWIKCALPYLTIVHNNFSRRTFIT